MKKIYLILSLSCLLTFSLKSQCAANYSYTSSGNGIVSFTNTSSGIGTNTALYWDFGDGQVAYNIPNPIHTYGANSNYNVRLTIWDSTLTCNDTITQLISVTNVTCNVVANMNINISNAYVKFINTSTGTLSGTSYSLHFGYGNWAYSFTNNSFDSIGISYPSSGTYTVTLTAINASTTCFDTYTTVINVVFPPCNLNAAFTYTVNSDTVTFSNTTIGTSSLATFQWNFGNGNYYFGFTPAQQIYLYNGTYTVTQTVHDSVFSECYDTLKQVINITGLPCTVNSSFIMGKDSTANPAIVWDVYPNYPSNVSAVLWSWGDGSSTSGLFPSHTYSAAGVYNICMSITVTCGSFTTICLNSNIVRQSGSPDQMAVVNVKNTSDFTGINKNQNRKSILIYPNPSKDKVTIEAELKGATLTLIDVFGKTVFSEIQKENKITLDLSAFPSGIYFLRTEGLGQKYVSKIIKE